MKRRLWAILVMAVIGVFLAGAAAGWAETASTAPSISTALETPAAPATGSADYPAYGSKTGLVASVDVIIVGQVVASATRDLDISLEGDPLVLPYLVSTVQVERVIKGDIKVGDLIEVKQPLYLQQQKDAQLLKAKETRALLFLEAYKNMPYSPANPDQGVVLIEGGNAVPDDSNRLFKTATSEADVVGELEKLVEN